MNVGLAALWSLADCAHTGRYNATQPHVNVLSALFSGSGVASLEDTLCSLCEL